MATAYGIAAAKRLKDTEERRQSLADLADQVPKATGGAPLPMLYAGALFAIAFEINHLCEALQRIEGLGVDTRVL